MNVLQTFVVFICFIAAEGNFPAVIFRKPYFLAKPAMLKYSETEMEVGFDYMGRQLYAACPVSDHDQSEAEIETNDPVSKRFLQRNTEMLEQRIFLSILPTCKSPPQVTSELVQRRGDYIEYSIGYKVYQKVYRKKEENDEADSSSYSRRDEPNLGEVFKLNFNTVAEKTTSVTYALADQKFFPTASSKKRIVAYEINKEFFEIDLDDLYHNFVDQILPRMEEEKSKNQLAHALGIQKVQLATPDDFPLDTWKMATYWNINTVPIWRVLIPRWNAIEIYIRKLHKRDMIINIETGASETLELAKRYNENNTLDKLHVPKYLWKLIHKTSPFEKAMLIVMHNDPFTEHQKPLCEDICAINGWLVSNNDYRTGLVYCCAISENVAQTLNYPIDMKNFGVYSFTRTKYGSEELNYMSRILSDPLVEYYDW